MASEKTRSNGSRWGLGADFARVLEATRAGAGGFVRGLTFLAAAVTRVAVFALARVDGRPAVETLGTTESRASIMAWRIEVGLGRGLEWSKARGLSGTKTGTGVTRS